METLPVTLIVKAPNQQIEDQMVQCELSWTIQKLKQHLSEVYPSKPVSKKINYFKFVLTLLYCSQNTNKNLFILVNY